MLYLPCFLQIWWLYGCLFSVVRCQVSCFIDKVVCVVRILAQSKFAKQVKHVVFYDHLNCLLVLKIKCLFLVQFCWILGINWNMKCNGWVQGYSSLGHELAILCLNLVQGYSSLGLELAIQEQVLWATAKGYLPLLQLLFWDWFLLCWCWLWFIVWSIRADGPVMKDTQSTLQP